MNGLPIAPILKKNEHKKKKKCQKTRKNIKKYWKNKSLYLAKVLAKPIAVVRTDVVKASHVYNAMTTQQMACANCMSPDMTKTLSSPVTIVNINKEIDEIKKNNWIDIFLPILSTIKAANAIPHASHNDWKTGKKMNKIYFEKIKQSKSTNKC